MKVWLVFIFCLAGAAGIALLDYAAGPDFSLFMFYVVPVIYAGLYTGPRASQLIVLLATAGVIWTELAPMLGQSPALIRWDVIGWNGFSSFALFSLLRYVISIIRKDRNRLEKLIDLETAAARTDNVTNLPNKRALVEYMEAWEGESSPSAQSLGLIFIDLDNFKRINDSFGHEAGDILLKEVGSTLRKHIRETDMVARIGGDEFVIFSRTKDRENLHEMANRIVEAIHEMEKEYPGTDFGASAGLVYYEEPSKSLDEMIHQADMAMYLAKNAGKNMVVG